MLALKYKLNRLLRRPLTIDEKKQDITAFLDKYFQITGTYTISDEGIINVIGEVELNIDTFNQANIPELPIQFGTIQGDFIFPGTHIVSLRGFPVKVTGTVNLDGSKRLTSLIGVPECKRCNCNNFSESMPSLEGINCKEFVGAFTWFDSFGCKFTAHTIMCYDMPIITANEMRHLIHLKPDIVTTDTKRPEVWLLHNYKHTNDLMQAITSFTELYNEPFMADTDIKAIPAPLPLDGVEISL